MKVGNDKKKKNTQTNKEKRVLIEEDFKTMSMRNILQIHLLQWKQKTR